MTTTNTEAGTLTVECGNCRRYTAVVPEGRVNRLYDFEADGFTPSFRRHVCGESDRRHA